MDSTIGVLMLYSLKSFCCSLVIVILAIGICPHLALAQENQFGIVIKDHKFSPVELKVPANKKIKLIIENHDPTPEEFESYDFNREKVVSGNGKITVFIGPLKPGTYKYFGDFHMDSAQGVIIAE